MKQWLRGGANNAPHHASGTRATDRALSHTRSLTAAAGNKCMAPTDADGKAQTIYDVDPVEGQFKLEGLDWGTYTLEETKSPDGYDLDSTVRTFTFGPKSDADGTGNWYSNSVDESNTDKTGAFTTADKTYESDAFDFAVGGGVRTSRGWCCRRLVELATLGFTRRLWWLR